MKTTEQRLEAIEANQELQLLVLRDICAELGIRNRVRDAMATLDELNGGTHDTEPAPAPGGQNG